MRMKRKRLVAVLVLFCSVSALAVFFSILLGKAYLGMLESVEIKKSPKQPETSTPVVAREETKSIGIVPVPVFFLQGGVYSDIEGARKAAEDFLKIGIDPYITGAAPYRLYIGFFGSREGAEKLKAHLAGEGLSAFIQSFVLNDTALTYNKEKENLVNRWVPLLQKSSGLLKDAGGRADFGAFSQADMAETQANLQYLTGEFDKLVSEFDSFLSEQGEIGPEAQDLADSVSAVRDSLKKLGSEWNQDNYDAVAKGLTDLVHAYSNCWYYLNNSDET